MKRLLLALVPWMVTATAALGYQARSADVAYTYFPTLQGKAFRVLDECFVPVTSLSEWGWKALVRDNMVDLEAEGQQARVPMRTFKRMQAIPLRSTIEQLGGTTTWEGDSDILDVLAKVRFVTVRNGKITIESTMRMKPAVFQLPDPSRVVVDLTGAVLDSKADTSLDPGVRAAQFKDNVVRVVMESGNRPETTTDLLTPTRRFQLDTNSVASNQDNQGDSARQDPVVPQNQPATPLVQNTTPIYVESETAKTTTLTLKLSGPLQRAALMKRATATRLELTFPGVKLDLPSDLDLKSEAVTSASASFSNGDSTLILELARPVGAEISTNGLEVHILLVKPDVGDGRLAGKTIVVDAGHGGKDNGAKALDGSAFEKNLTLSIGKILAQKLAAEGATVIMTRKTDVFIPLEERSAIANRNNADLFLSVHINSNGLDTNSSGTITFYHGCNTVSSVLADCIEREIGKVSGLPMMGVWSDTRIYHSGFAVLRNSRMPAVLIETGFINNKRDRARMRQEEFQYAFTAAVVKGVKVYLGDEQTQKEKQ